jgi:myo-inositol-1(or 4)-monophosphatase
MNMKYRDILFLALREAGALIRRNFDRKISVSFKHGSPINLVTKTDQAADRLIRGIILKSFPTHDLLTEESLPTGKQSAYKWIVDPLDGTTNFAHHFPQCCVSIALEYTPHPPLSLKGEGQAPPSPFRGKVAEGRMRGSAQIILGGVYDPFRDELFWAAKGRGAWLIHAGRQKRLSVSPTDSLSRALLLTGFPYDRRERADLYLMYVKAFMKHIQGIRRAGAAALDLSWVACGRVDGYWEWRLKPWDVAAGVLIVTEAGGRVSDFCGKRFSAYGEQTLATNGRIHHSMLREMRVLPR